QVQRHERQRKELEQKLQGGQAKLRALHAEREALRRAQHQADVAALLGDTPASGTATAGRVTAIAAEIEAGESYLTAARDALQLHAQIAEGVRRQLQQDIDREVATAALEVSRRMVPLVRQVLTLDAELTALLTRAPSPVGVLPIPHAPLLNVWLAQFDRQGQ
ncbi:MAG: hypothetical protein ABIW19_14600, partial [Vicinamibacterales bacterium]